MRKYLKVNDLQIIYIVLHTKSSSKMKEKEQKISKDQIEKLNDIAKRYSGLNDLNYLRIAAKAEVHNLLEKDNLTEVEEMMVAISYFTGRAICKLMTFEGIIKEIK